MPPKKTAKKVSIPNKNNKEKTKDVAKKKLNSGQKQDADSTTLSKNNKKVNNSKEKEVKKPSLSNKSKNSKSDSAEEILALKKKMHADIFHRCLEKKIYSSLEITEDNTI